MRGVAGHGRAASRSQEGHGMRGEQDAGKISQAYQDHRPYLIDLAFRMLGDIGAAEDIVQDAFTRLMAAKSGEIEDERGWLIVVTSRLCLDQIKSARSRRERAHDASEIEFVRPSQSGLADVFGLNLLRTGRDAAQVPCPAAQSLSRPARRTASQPWSSTDQAPLRDRRPGCATETRAQRLHLPPGEAARRPGCAGTPKVGGRVFELDLHPRLRQPKQFLAHQLCAAGLRARPRRRPGASRRSEAGACVRPDS